MHLKDKRDDKNLQRFYGSFRLAARGYLITEQRGHRGHPRACQPSRVLGETPYNEMKEITKKVSPHLEQFLIGGHLNKDLIRNVFLVAKSFDKLQLLGLFGIRKTKHRTRELPNPNIRN